MKVELYIPNFRRTGPRKAQPLEIGIKMKINRTIHMINKNHTGHHQGAPTIYLTLHITSLYVILSKKPMNYM